jgi:hypothetical protein
MEKEKTKRNINKRVHSNFHTHLIISKKVPPETPKAQ